jgi:hypothetical protein
LELAHAPLKAVLLINSLVTMSLLSLVNSKGI